MPIPDRVGDATSTLAQWRRRAARVLGPPVVALLASGLGVDALGLLHGSAGYHAGDLDGPGPVVILTAFDPLARQTPDSVWQAQLPGHPATTSPQAAAAFTRELLASGRADTLRAVLGWPRHVTTAPLRGAPEYTTLATYGPRDDTIEISPLAQSDMALRLTLAHELAHRLQALVGLDLGAWWGAHAVPLPAEHTYARTTVYEHQAEAIASAVEYLAICTTPGLRGTLAAVSLRQLDAETPGTTLMVRALLSHPLYAQHPLRTGALALGALDVTPLAPPWHWEDVHRPVGGPEAEGGGLREQMTHDASDPAWGRPVLRRLLHP